MEDQKPSRIRPWMVVAVLAVAGVAGAIAVTVAAKHQHKVDRADVATWERKTMSDIRGAVIAEQDLAKLQVTKIASRFSSTIHSNLALKRVTLDGVRQQLLDMRIPEILRLSAAQYLRGLTFTLRAVSLLDEAALSMKLPLVAPALTEYRLALVDAEIAFQEGESSLNELRCRTGLPPCSAG